METFSQNLETHWINITGTDAVVPIPFPLILLMVARINKSCELHDPGSGKRVVAGLICLSPDEAIPDCIQQAIACAEATAARRFQEICDSLIIGTCSVLTCYDELICEGFVRLFLRGESDSQYIPSHSDEFFDEFCRAFSTSLSFESLVLSLYLETLMTGAPGSLRYEALSELLPTSQFIQSVDSVQQNLENCIDLWRKVRRFTRDVSSQRFYEKFPVREAITEQLYKRPESDWNGPHRFTYDASSQISDEKFPLRQAIMERMHKRPESEWNGPHRFTYYASSQRSNEKFPLRQAIMKQMYKRPESETVLFPSPQSLKTPPWDLETGTEGYYTVEMRHRNDPIWSETLLKITLPLAVAYASAEFSGLIQLPPNAKIVFVASKFNTGVAIVSNFACYALEKAGIRGAGAVAKIMRNIEKFAATFAILSLMGTLLPENFKLWITGAVCALLLPSMAKILIE